MADFPAIRRRLYPDWAAFKSAMGDFATLSPARMDQFIFRGQGDSTWELEPTLDRFIRERALFDRETTLTALLEQFTRNVCGLDYLRTSAVNERAWELLGRHHGLPSPFLDWTKSGYVAAFFAFSDPGAAKAENVTVWTLDRNIFAKRPIPEIELIDDSEAVRSNQRAAEQRGIFLRIGSITSSVTDLLADGLVAIDLPVRMRDDALADLDLMTINDRSLFRDLDGAARVAAARVGRGATH